jgi:hypothetical protein
MMDFRQASPRKAAATKTTKKRTSTGNTGTQGQIKFTANPIARQRSLQQIRDETEAFDASSWSASDEDEDYNPKDPIDGGDTDVEGDIPLKDAKRRRVASGPSTTGAKARSAALQASEVINLASASDIDRPDTPTLRYRELKAMYLKVCRKPQRELIGTEAGRR